MLAHMAAARFLAHIESTLDAVLLEARGREQTVELVPCSDRVGVRDLLENERLLRHIMGYDRFQD